MDSNVPDASVSGRGEAGSSTEREYERRVAVRERRVLGRHPVLGGLLLALVPEPQSTTAWKIGAEGEKRLAARLDRLASPTVRLLHDRRIPRTRANLDHIVVTSHGVTVIDAKHYRGRPHLQVRRERPGPRIEELYVGRRNCRKLVDGALWQADRVRLALQQPGLTVTAMLCFVDADWPLLGGAFTTRGVHVVWPRRAERLLRGSGLPHLTTIEALHRELARAFPPA